MFDKHIAFILIATYATSRFLLMANSDPEVRSHDKNFFLRRVTKNGKGSSKVV